MKKEIKVHVEKITDGYLFTETVEENKKKKYFKESKFEIFELLNKSDEVVAILKNDNDVMLEISLYDIEEEVEDPNLYERVVVQEKFNPFKDEPIDEEELRLSVNIENAYSAARLKSIDFLGLDSQLQISHVRKAEIAGVNYQVVMNGWRHIKLGDASFGSPQARIGFTVLAKFYELSLNIRTSKKDEIERLREGIEKEIKELDSIFKRNAHIHTNSVGPILESLKNLIKSND